MPKLLSLVIPAYNEATILENNLVTIFKYLQQLDYLWQVIIINDGSQDTTGEIADKLAQQWDIVKVIHHPKNMGLGAALKTGFRASKGDYVIVYDADLSYNVNHIENLANAIEKNSVHVVLASPYMIGGEVSDVPALRKFLSIWANRLLALTVNYKIHTLTAMVRIYEGVFIRALSLRCSGMEINLEILYKALIVGAEIREIPAHLKWLSLQGDNSVAVTRKSSMKILRHTLKVFQWALIFNPVMFWLIAVTLYYLVTRDMTEECILILIAIISIQIKYYFEELYYQFFNKKVEK